MNLNVSTAIIIGAVIIFSGIIFNGWYERTLAYNTCVKMVKENPFRQTKYNKPKFIEKYCRWNVIVKKGNDKDFLLYYKETFK
jgi:hypothetical protein